jgi:hypothetical protein
VKDLLGRPEYSDNQYRSWLNDISPFLKMGHSLYSAMNEAMLLQHKDSIYRKYRLNDWFCEKIEVFQGYPGKIVNGIFSRLILIIDEKIRRGQQISTDEWHNLRFFAEKHRSCKAFFVGRQEITRIEPDRISDVLDKLE